MKIDDGIKTVVAIGKFDGIHKGHERIIRRMMEYRQRGYKTLIFTFDIQPQSLLNSRENRVLTTGEEKRYLFSELGIDFLVELPFCEKTAGISAEDFLKEVLIKRLKCRAIVCGPDLRFGKGGKGNVAMLNEYCMEGKNSKPELNVIEKVNYNGSEISSSRIREAIMRSDIEEANEMLLAPYTFYGRVSHGRKLGRTLGMPTVNLLPRAEKLLPKSGVYFSRVRHMGVEYRSITNIGTKPTVVKSGEMEGPVMGVETYLYNFNKEIYGDRLMVSLYHFLRPEIKFESVDKLKLQMEEDIKKGEKWHKSHI
ncbi:MAG: bifunctional riboflavin kinase/FAD synthetase [Lachnospiraceae bacterium]|nr:bifunctional riboflavin kinase/FAD synthetase [Lachnospiraceae bacterium]